MTQIVQPLFLIVNRSMALYNVVLHHITVAVETAVICVIT